MTVQGGPEEFFAARSNPPLPSCACGAALLEPSDCSTCGRALLDEAGVLRLVDDSAAESSRFDSDSGSSWLHAGAALLADLPPHRPVLCLATGWSKLPTALDFLGYSVVNADFSYDRLMQGRQDSSSASRVVNVHVDHAEPLPWPDSTFPVVYVNAVELERRGLTQERITSLLAEVERVLAPSGAVILACSNAWRAALRRWRSARREGNPATPWRALRSARVSVSPWNGALRRTGLRVERIYVPLPGLDLWSLLVPRSQLRQRLRFYGAGARHRVLDVLRRIGLAWLVVPHALVIARVPLHSSAGNSLAEALSSSDAVIIPRYTAKVAVDSARRFVKLAFSDFEEQNIVDEVRRTAEATRSWGGGVGASARSETWFGRTVSVFPHVDSRDAPLEEVREELSDVFRSLASNGRTELQKTDVYRRVTHPANPVNFEHPTLRALASHVTRAAERIVEVGPSHGDPEPEDTLALKESGVVLIDWAYAEPCNPRFLDPVYAATFFHMELTGKTLAQAVLDWCDGRIPGSLAAVAEDYLGDLDRLDSAIWRVLHKVSLFTESVECGEYERDHLDAAEVLLARLTARGSSPLDV